MTKRDCYLVFQVELSPAEVLSYWYQNNKKILGVCFVFKRKKDAEKYAKEFNAKVITTEVVEYLERKEEK